MDCEKFESTLIDELYDELDELTSAAAKRHVAGCARCASLLSGLKATRRVAVLPILEPPADLEDRILAAAKDAQKVVPMKRRVSNAVSWAGSWAMRPQTAMAAVFLLMIGSSALLLRGRSAKAPASAANVTVSAEGSPAPSTATATLARPADLEAADNAHGVPGAPRAEPAAPAPVALNGPAAAATAAASGFVANNASGGGGSAGRSAFEGLAKSAPAPKPSMLKDLGASDDYGDTNAYDRRQAGTNAAGVAGAPAAPPAAAQAPAQKQEAQEQKKATASSDFDNGMAQYRAQNYGEAARLFDSASASGDLVAALYAARSVENQGGCSAAIGRYEELGSKAFGTTAGYDATLAAGHCYRLLGDYDRARQRLNRLLTVQTHARQAQTELDMLTPKAVAKPAARAAPAAPPPAKVDVNQAY